MTLGLPSRRLADPDATAALARRLGCHLRAGDCLLLDGPIGAGKTHFARHLILSLLSAPEDVPSPTFTLVQTYDTNAGEVLHVDLYRVGSPGEIHELGLLDAFDQAICLVEWPERLGALTPPAALTLRLTPDAALDDVRHIEFSWTDPKWGPVLQQVIHD